jgi:hypothetical protein
MSYRPVSRGTMAANGSGLQLATLRNIVLAWVLTLPAAMMLSGVLSISFPESLLNRELWMRAIVVI